jgi:Na+/serine symporter
MCQAAEILVYILSAFLAVFLIVGIILGIYLIILTKQIRKVTKSAEKTVDDIGSVVSKASKIIQPIFIVETVTSILNKIKKKKGDN